MRSLALPPGLTYSILAATTPERVIPAGVLGSIVEAQGCASTDHTRYLLNSVLLTRHEVVATDGLALRSALERLIIADVGQNKYEEVNVVDAARERERGVERLALPLPLPGSRLRGGAEEPELVSPSPLLAARAPRDGRAGHAVYLGAHLYLKADRSAPTRALL